MKNTESYLSYLKSPYKSIKHTTYFNSYEHFFSKYRNKKITFVEIGVLSGGSLFMWRNYFGPKARIIGVDLNPNAKKWEANGFEIFIGNQSDQDFWNEFKKKVKSIDIVLDDGGHTYEQQIITTEFLLDAINDGGILVVEDTHTSYMSGFGPKKFSFIEYVKNRIDAVNYRFNKFSEKCAEKRFWSIEIIESMVAFKINKKATNILPETTNNGGEDDLAADFRYQDIPTVNKLEIEKLPKSVKFLNSLPPFKLLARYIKNIIINHKFIAKKYFK